MARTEPWTSPGVGGGPDPGLEWEARRGQGWQEKEDGRRSQQDLERSTHQDGEGSA